MTAATALLFFFAQAPGAPLPEVDGTPSVRLLAVFAPGVACVALAATPVALTGRVGGAVELLAEVL